MNNTNIIEYRSSSGLMEKLIGLPFFVAGLVFLYFWIDPSTQWNPERPPLYFILPFCSIFIIIGVVLNGHFSGFKYNATLQEFYVYTGVFCKLVKNRYSKSMISEINVSKKLVRSKNNSYYKYTIILKQKMGKDVEIFSNLNYEISREFGEKISRETKISFKDEVSGGEKLSYDEVDKAFVDKIRDLNLTLPENPIGSRIKYKQELLAFECLIPSDKPLIIYLIPAILISVFELPIIFIILSFFPKEGFILIPFIFLLFVPTTLIAYKGLKKHVNTTALKVDKNSLYYIMKGVFTQEGVISLRNIDDIVIDDVNNKNNLNQMFFSSFKKAYFRIIYNNEVIAIGPFNSEEERRFVYDLICYQISLQK